MEYSGVLSELGQVRFRKVQRWKQRQHFTKRLSTIWSSTDLENVLATDLF